MIRAIVLIFLTTISVSGQDSTLVRKFCNTFGQFSDTTDIQSQVLGSFDIIKKYLERNPLTGDDQLQEVLRFQYRLARELKRNCPNYPSDRVRLTPKPVIDLENKLTKQQIDSLDILTSQIETDKNVYLYIVSIDNFYPDSSITDFANRYREFWAPRTNLEKGIVLIVFSATQKQIRISTGDISMKFLTDAECSEVNKVIIPHFKGNNYFDGLVDGLLAIKSRL